MRSRRFAAKEIGSRWIWMRRQRDEKSRQTCEKHLLFFRMFVKQVYRGFVESRIAAGGGGENGAGEGPKRLRIVERVERITGSAWQGRRMRKVHAGVETGRNRRRIEPRCAVGERSLSSEWR